MNKGTAVLQSFRTHQVPSWINTALASVRSWTQTRGYDYIFTDDTFFDYAPRWVQGRCATQFFPITDIARLYYLKAYLAKGYERVVWVDADVLVFEDQLFDIDVSSDYAFCREVMMGGESTGRLTISPPSLNNAVMFFRQGCPMLDFYRFAAEEILRRTAPEKIERTTVGPKFLRALAKSMPIARLNCVGLFTPLLMADLSRKSTELWSIYQSSFRYPMGAANLCHFSRHYADDEQRALIDQQYNEAIDFIFSLNHSS